MNYLEPLKKEGAEVYIFGSRAKNTYKKFSDVDIYYKDAILTAPISTELVNSIIITFEDSQFPYKIDLVKYESLAKSYLADIEASRVRV